MSGSCVIFYFFGNFNKIPLGPFSFEVDWCISVKRFLFQAHTSTHFNDFCRIYVPLVLHNFSNRVKMCKWIWNFLSENNQPISKLSVGSDWFWLFWPSLFCDPLCCPSTLKLINSAAICWPQGRHHCGRKPNYIKGMQFKLFVSGIEWVSQRIMTFS